MQIFDIISVYFVTFLPVVQLSIPLSCGRGARGEGAYPSPVGEGLGVRAHNR
jgi:hypothetical protein